MSPSLGDNGRRQPAAGAHEPGGGVAADEDKASIHSRPTTTGTVGNMATLPRSTRSLLVRTNFTDDDAWQQLAEDAVRTYEDFHADVLRVSDPAFDGADWTTVKAAVPADRHGAAVLFIADRTTLTAPEHPILVVDLIDNPTLVAEPFRCVPSQLSAVEANLNIQNMFWEEFADHTDQDGVFRGFPRRTTPP